MTTPQSTPFLQCKNAKDLNKFSRSLLWYYFCTVFQCESKGGFIILVYKPKMKISSIWTQNPLQRKLLGLSWEKKIPDSQPNISHVPFNLRKAPPTSLTIQEQPNTFFCTKKKKKKSSFKKIIIFIWVKQFLFLQHSLHLVAFQKLQPPESLREPKFFI